MFKLTWRDSQLTALPTFPAAWFTIPPEASKNFFPAIVRVSVALQTELRRILPQQYFSKVERFENPHQVNPLLVYAASRPFRARCRTDFAWDTLNKKVMKSFYLTVHNKLSHVLAPVYRRLREAGLNDIARAYRPDRSTNIIAVAQRHKLERHRLHHILTIESRMVNDLVPFAGAGKMDPVRQQQLAQKCGKAFLKDLRRIYGKYDYTPFAQEIIDAITPALSPPVPEPDDLPETFFVTRDSSPLRTRDSDAG